MFFCVSVLPSDAYGWLCDYVMISAKSTETWLLVVCCLNQRTVSISLLVGAYTHCLKGDLLFTTLYMNEVW